MSDDPDYSQVPWGPDPPEGGWEPVPSENGCDCRWHGGPAADPEPDDPEPEPVAHAMARTQALWDQAEAHTWAGNPAAEAAMREFEADYGGPEAEA